MTRSSDRPGVVVSRLVDADVDPSQAAVIRAALDAGEPRVCLVVPGDQHPEAACPECGRANVIWNTASDVWNLVARPEEILCVGCFVGRFAAAYPEHRILTINTFGPLIQEWVPPAVWVKLDQPCATCDGDSQGLTPCEADCLLGRQVHELRETCPKCHGDYSYRECDHCQNGSVLRVRAAVRVLPVVDYLRRIPDEPCIEVVTPSYVREWHAPAPDSTHDALMQRQVALDPPPRPGVDWVVLLEFVP